MKKSFKTIRTITTVGILLISAYILGTTQSNITKVNTSENDVVIVPDDYIKLDECIPLKDIACYYMHDGYICFELKDISKQLDNKDNKSYVDIIKNLECRTTEY